MLLFTAKEKKIPAVRLGLTQSGWPRKFVMRKEDVKQV